MTQSNATPEKRSGLQLSMRGLLYAVAATACILVLIQCIPNSKENDLVQTLRFQAELELIAHSIESREIDENFFDNLSQDFSEQELLVHALIGPLKTEYYNFDAGQFTDKNSNGRPEYKSDLPDFWFALAKGHVVIWDEKGGENLSFDEAVEVFYERRRQPLPSWRAIVPAIILVLLGFQLVKPSRTIALIIVAALFVCLVFALTPAN